MASTADSAKSPFSSESEGELFEVESILGKRTRHGKVEYLIRWKGFGPSEDSWEPVKNLQGCQQLIKDFTKTRSPSPGRKARTPKRTQTSQESQTKQEVIEEYTKLKTPRTKTSTTSEYVILHRKKGPMSAKKEVKEEKVEVKNTERIEIKQEKHEESVVREPEAKDTTPAGESTVTTTDGRREVFKMVAALVVFTLLVLVFFSLIPGVGEE